MNASARRMLERVADRLTIHFFGTFSADIVYRYVVESYELLAATARVQRHLVVLTERFAAQRLTALAQADGNLAKPVVEVLFVCDGNAGRSQMAAALAVVRSRGRLHARSAGRRPAAALELGIVSVMEEIGVDLTAEFPKPLTDELVRAADVVVTLGCGGACAIHPGTRYLDWPVPNPVGLPLDEVRRIRDEIDLLVTDLLESLPAP
ncbi:three-helix bundle dimerization domain-containing protein [Actinomadura sp. SCN-SB]|uniref:arsenate reductase/protein-tyrosine-phosphatase family protein n=1 Tax=Actinomadura sp. SCN-SB TaxID=3373092 RepID=UPI003751D47B